jgi:uncharacterized protein YbcI
MDRTGAAPHPQTPSAPDDFSTLSAISNTMVRIYKDQFGRGPTKVRSQWAGPDILLVTLEHTLTPAEHKLRDMGEHARLRDLRMLFQYADVGLFIKPVEDITGRTVRAFVSGMDVEADVATEVFVMHPANSSGTSRRSQ